MDAHQEASTTLKMLIFIFVGLMISVLGYMVINTDIMASTAYEETPIKIQARPKSLSNEATPSSGEVECDKLNTDINNNCN